MVKYPHTPGLFTGTGMQTATRFETNPPQRIYAQDLSQEETLPQSPLSSPVLLLAISYVNTISYVKTT